MGKVKLFEKEVLVNYIGKRNLEIVLNLNNYYFQG